MKAFEKHFHIQIISQSTEQLRIDFNPEVLKVIQNPESSEGILIL